jgi:type II secretory pathway pseudopilin PulG
LPFNISRYRAFTLMEILVLLAIFIVLMSILLPFALSKREEGRRARCYENLRQIGFALNTYVSQYGTFPRVIHNLDQPEGYAAFTGPDDPDPFAAGSTVSPNDVTASLWLLVRTRLITDTRLFVCPSSDDYRDTLLDASGRPTDPTRRSNFRSTRNLSYSYASPFTSAPGYRFNNDIPGGVALLAERNPGVLVEPDAPPRELARGNSPNHGSAGQNILYVGCYGLPMERTPYCGVGYDSRRMIWGDNIYSARTARPATQPTSMPFSVTGFIGHDVSPSSISDSYLVPTAQDRDPWAMPATRPSTTTSTSPATTTAPTTTTTSPATSAPTTSASAGQ